MTIRAYLLAGVTAFTLAACGNSTENAASNASEAASKVATDSLVKLAASDDFAVQLQLALIEAQPGATIELPEGVFYLTDGLSLTVDNVSIKGAGQNKTVLDFSQQSGAGEGLLITSDGVTLSDFTMRETAGDGIKSKGADQIIYRDLTVEWGAPDPANGAYAVYPVESRDILIDGVTVRGASDAGIYVGQSENIIVRNSLAEYNVAGIEIENSTHADVYGNVTQHNTGGILVFDLPDIPVVGGHSTRVFNNKIVNNNTVNFAPPGNIVATVPSGTGLIVLATDNLHVFNNEFDGNKTAHVALTSYLFETSDERYNPHPLNVVLRNNTYGEGGSDPQGILEALGQVTGGAVPPIVWDGITQYGDMDPVDVNLTIQEDESVGFINLGVGSSPMTPDKINPSMERPSGTPNDEPKPIVLPHVANS